jgi:TonB-dependent starch-binding outer membrane protein SusC
MVQYVRKLLTVMVASLAWTASAAAQSTGRVAGRVIDEGSNGGIASATVQVVGSQLGASTRADGGFTITGVPTGAQRVRVTRLGFAPKEIAISVSNNETVTIQVALSPVAASISGVVVTGYGTQRREAITGAVATVKGDDANVGVIPNATGLLTGRVAGVNVIANSGDPGAGAQIRIRGGTSISGGNDPLYVIDGVPITNDATEVRGAGIGGSNSLPRNPLNLLNPSDIANITVLKDASATAIYGSRGANGVVLIETKKGSTSGASTLEYEGFAAASSRSNSLGLLTGSEYRSFVQEQVSAGRLPQSRLADLGTANTDWEDAIAQTGMTQNHNLSFSGGSQNTQYRASLNYLNQEGVVIANGLQRFQGRLNANHLALDGKLRLQLNLSSSRVDNDYLPFENTGGFEGGVFANMATFNPTFPVRGTSGQFFELGLGAQSVRNPVAIAEQILDQASTNRTLGNLSATYTIVPSLTASVTAGVDNSNGLRKTYWPRINPVGAGFGGRAFQNELGLQNQNLQTLMTWAPKFGSKMDFDIVGGYEFSEFTRTELGAEGRNFITDAFSFNNLGGGAVLQPPTSSRTDSRLVSFFSRANWGWNDKYFVTGVIRRDGSSKFGEGNKWAVFPAVSGAWRISSEDFLKNSTLISNLRLRAGWGLQGNQGVDPYASLILLEPNNGARYPIGDQVVTGVVPTRNANPLLKWEQTAQTNVALDFGLKNNKYTGTLEFYNKTTEDLLLTVLVPQPALVRDRLENVGSLKNRGFEGTFDAQLFQQKDFDLSSGVVLTVERNEVVSLGGSNFIVTASVSGQGQSGQNAQRILPGRPLGTFWGPEYVGLNAQGQQLFNKYTVTRDAKGVETGRTLNGTTTSPGGDDATVIGDANPAFSLGWRGNARWKKFDLSFLMRGEFGRDVFNNTSLIYGTKANVNQSRNFLRSALNDGQAISEPAIYSSRWIEDGSFFRLQNVTVGYAFNLPSGIRRGSTARLFLSGDNLLLFTPYSGYDPEVFVDAGLASRGIDYIAYPRARTFTTGVRVQF